MPTAFPKSTGIAGSGVGKNVNVFSRMANFYGPKGNPSGTMTVLTSLSARTRHLSYGQDVSQIQVAYRNSGSTGAGTGEAAIGSSTDFKCAIQVQVGAQRTVSNSGGTTTTATVIGAPTSTTYYTGQFGTENWIVFTSGALNGAYRQVASNNGSSITVSSGFGAIATSGTSTVPTVGDTYLILEHHPIFFGGKRLQTCDSGALLYSDPQGVYIPANGICYFHTFISFAPGASFPLNLPMNYYSSGAATGFPHYDVTNAGDGGSSQAIGSAASTGVGGSDMVDSGNMSAGVGLGIASGALLTAMSGSGVGLCAPSPSAVLSLAPAPRIFPSFTFEGNSRLSSQHQSPATTAPAALTNSPYCFEDNGPFSQVCNAQGFPYMVLARGGETLSNQFGFTFQIRESLSITGDYPVFLDVVNDLGNSTDVTAADIIANLKVWCNRKKAKGQRPVVCTAAPVCTSTNSFLTTASMSIANATNNTRRLAANAWITGAGITGGWIYRAIDVCSVLEDPSNPGLWNPAALMQGLGGTSTGTLGTLTADDDTADMTDSVPTWSTSIAAAGYCYVSWVTSVNHATGITNAVPINGIRSTVNSTRLYIPTNGVITKAGDTYNIYMPLTNDGTHFTIYGISLLKPLFNPSLFPMY